MNPNLPFPKKEPKAEHLQHSQNATPNAKIPKTLTLIPPNPIRFDPKSFPPNPAADRRHVASFLRSLSGKTRTCPTPNPNGIVVAAAKRRKPQPRSSELRRVSSIPAEDALLLRNNVRRTRILYESIRISLLQEEGPKPCSGHRSRVDLNAATLMKDHNLWLNRDVRTVGNIPGVYVGDIFFYRIELCVLGLHGQVQAGIDTVPAGQSSTGEPIATSIIVSGGYEDDVDRGNVLIYTGHGGREGKNETKHSLDQKLQGGNLGLERSCNYGIEIRVIRGLDCERSLTNRVYVYDGLYRVTKWWSEMGKSGFNVFKFRLERIEGQEEMGSVAIKLAERLKEGLDEEKMKGYLCGDISKGKEKLPVAVYNDVDDEKDPLLFDYLVRPLFNFETEGPVGQGCKCEGDCSVGCECIRRNGGEMAFDGNGKLLRGRPVVFECGRSCRCSSSCLNRVTQKGLRHRLEVFRSKEIGWGVRSLDFIRAGEFVCEFTGILLSKEQTVEAEKNGACLIYPSKFSRNWEEWGDLSSVRSDHEKPNCPPVPGVDYSLDVSKVRNVACYLSNSCIPNVFVQFVLFHRYNVQYPRLMVFALENIPPMRELSLDYGI